MPFGTRFIAEPLPLIMRESQLTTLLLLICINSMLCQNTIELIAYDCNRERTSNSDISEIKLKILSEHQVISQSTKSKYDIFTFETSKNEIKIEYYNVYNQKIDTSFIITPKTQKLFLCVEKMKDYHVKTFLETSLSENKKWKLEWSGSIKSKTTIEIIPRKKKTLFKYSHVDEYRESGKKIKKENIIELSENDINKLIVFEKKLRLLNEGLSRCGPEIYYKLTLNNEKLVFKDKTTCFKIYKDYLKELIEKNN